MENRKIFVGSAKKKEFQKGGSILNASICLDDLINHSEEFQTISTGNGKKYIKLKITSRKEPDNFGNTHSVEIDTWKPEQQQSGNVQAQSAPQSQQNFEDDIPF